MAKAVRLLKEGGIAGFRVFMAGGLADTRDSRQYHEELLEYVRREKLDCIEMEGHVTDMDALRRKVHVEIVPSVMEAFGRVTVEATLRIWRKR